MILNFAVLQIRNGEESRIAENRRRKLERRAILRRFAAATTRLGRGTTGKNGQRGKQQSGRNVPFGRPPIKPRSGRTTQARIPA